eukprot:GAHX01001268.1.p1 GENE.GAHX01001268.1~~GAHX01001268.1.p1  ORF type:complete len:224 (-),score=55.41 GAHX01001268.1:701-1372(-)
MVHTLFILVLLIFTSLTDDKKKATFPTIHTDKLISMTETNVKNYESALDQLKTNVDKFKKCLSDVKHKLEDDSFANDLDKSSLDMNKYGMKKRLKEQAKKTKNSSVNFAKKINGFFNKNKSSKEEEENNENERIEKGESKKSFTKKQMWEIIENKNDKEKFEIKQSLYTTFNVKKCLKLFKKNNQNNKSRLNIDSDHDYKKLNKYYEKTILQEDYELRGSYTQ